MQIAAQDIEHILITIIICEYSVEAPEKRNSAETTQIQKGTFPFPFTIDLSTKMDFDSMRLLTNPKPIYQLCCIVIGTTESPCSKGFIAKVSPLGLGGCHFEEHGYRRHLGY
jgi:hypothetical protein